MSHRNIAMLSISDTSTETRLLPASRAVLGVPELLSLILTHVDGKALARMARLATFTHGPSIRCLWGRPRYGLFDELLRILTGQKLTKDGTKLVLPCPTEGLDWARFKHYSVHVTDLRLEGLSLSAASFSHFINRSNFLFPRLQRLSTGWVDVEEYRNAEWFAIAGPSLQVLNLSLTFSLLSDAVNLVALNSLLQKLPLQTPSLNELSLPTFQTLEPGIVARKYLTAAFASTLPALVHLKKLSWAWVCASDLVLEPVKIHPHLSELALAYPPMLLPAEVPSFRSLTRLSLKNSGEEVMTSWLAHLARPDLLEEVDMTLIRQPGEQVLTIPQFVLPLSQAVNLTRISIEFLSRKFIRWSSLEPLLACRLVSHFQLDGLPNPPRGLNDEALGTLAKSWRSLESLHITTTQNDCEALVTVYGLLPLAVYCHNLSSVGLMVSMRFDEERLQNLHDQCQSRGPHSHTLNTLALGFSNIGTRDFVEEDPEEFLDPRSIARLLRSLWPSLKASAVVSSWGEEEWEVGWMAIMWERFSYIRHFLEEMELSDERERRPMDTESLLKEKDRLIEEKTRLAEVIANELTDLKQKLGKLSAGR